MLTLDFGSFLILLVLALVAMFGYYGAFMSLLSRKASLSETQVVRGGAALALGFIQLLGAIVASAMAILFYFTLVR